MNTVVQILYRVAQGQYSSPMQGYLDLFDQHNYSHNAHPWAGRGSSTVNML